MGQYYMIANLDKSEFLCPHKFGQGLKLMEFSGAGHSIMQALAVLLADGNGRGGGDLRTDSPLIGSWAGDRIVVAGDYADPDRFGVEGTVYDAATNDVMPWRDVSDSIIKVIVEGEKAYGHPLDGLDLNSTGWRRPADQ